MYKNGETRGRQIQAAKPSIRREVLRQVIAPRRVILARFVLYYARRIRGLEWPWFAANVALRELAESGALVREPIDGVTWYRLPYVSPDKLNAARDRNTRCYGAWMDSLARGARQAEALWRQAFAREGWIVESRPRRILCPMPDDREAGHTEEHEIDVYAKHRGRGFALACEIKNGLSEGWIDPDIVREWKLTAPMREMRHHFRAMQSLGLTPMLASPFVDPSFYVFQGKHGGVHANYLWQVFAPQDEGVAREVKETFRLGHVWAEPDPPDNFRQFARRLPALLTGLATRQLAAQEESAEEPIDEHEL